MDLRQFLGILRARWKFIVMTIAFGAAVTTAVIVLWPKSYASTASLFISTPSTGVADTYSATMTAGQRAESYANLAKDPEVLARVGERLDIKRTPDELAGQIETSVVELTLLLRVDTTASSPELAQQIASVESDEIIRLVKNLETPSDEEIPAPIIARLAGKPLFEANAVSPDVKLYLAIGLLVSLLVGITGALLLSLIHI